MPYRTTLLQIQIITSLAVFVKVAVQLEGLPTDPEFQLEVSDVTACQVHLKITVNSLAG